MATINDSTRDNYGVRGIFRRDFRADKSGPEELPHRRPGRGKKKCKRAKTPNGEHEFTKRLEVYKYKWDQETRKRVSVLTSITVCARCGKPQYYFSIWG